MSLQNRALEDSAFETGKEYVYHYNGRLQIKNPEQPLQSSGFAFRSKVVAQPKSDHTYFKITDFEVDSFNGDRIILDDHQFNYHSTDDLREFIERPFAGTFSHGKIVEIAIGREEPLWSKNLKKGVLSTFQLDLVTGRQNNPHVEEYTTREHGLHGNCETKYLVTEKEGHIEVFKVRDLDLCDKEAHIVYGRIKGHKCVECEAMETHPLSSTFEVKYRLDGTPQHYVIKHASAASDTLFQPFGAGKAVRVVVNRTLFLDEERAANADMQLPDDVGVSDELTHSFSEYGKAQTLEDLKHPNHYITDSKLQNGRQKFVEGLNHLAAFGYDDSDIGSVDTKESGALRFLLLFRSMASMRYEDIEQVYEQNVVNAPEPNRQNVRRLFLDVLAAAGSNPHVAFGLKLLKEGKLSGGDAEHFLTRLPLNLKEHSPALITQLAVRLRLFRSVQHLRYVVPLWDNVQRFSKPLDYTQSQLALSSGYDPEYDYGGATIFSMIQADDSYLPRSLYLKAKDYYAGYSYDTIAMSFEGWGLNKLIDGVAGPRPGSTKNLWNFGGRRRFTREASAKDRKEIEDALPIQDWPFDPFYARIGLSMYGNEIDTWEIDERMLAELKESDKPGDDPWDILTKKVRRKSFFLNNDYVLLVPTDMGVSVFMDFKSVDFAFIDRQKFDFARTADDKFSLDVKRRYVFENRGFSVVGVALTFNETAVGSGSDSRTVLSLPLELKATLDTLNHKLHLQRPLALPWNILNHHNRPSTFALPFDPTRDIGNAVIQLADPPTPLYNKFELTEIDRGFRTDSLPIGLNVEGSMLSKGLSEGLHKFWYEMDWRQKFYYAAMNPHWHPRELRLTLVEAEKNFPTTIELDLSHKFLKPEDARESKFPITFNGKFTHTDDDAQQIRENAEAKPRSPNRLRPYYLRDMYAKCVHHQKLGIPLNYYCVKYMYYSSRLGKLTMDVEYKKLKPLLPGLYYHMTEYHSHSEDHVGFFGVIGEHMDGPTGKLRVVSQVPPRHKCADVLVSTSDGHHFFHPHVPLYSHILEPRVFVAFGYSNIAEYTAYYKQSEYGPPTASFYRGSLCGLCADYNYDRLNELLGSDHQVHNDTLEFAESYVVPSSDCTPP
ncbi:hemelipoglycoprotein precursor, putative [Ixodes scapularis]|uniref:Hemelipoglycoprotein, putative n=1 Tax=Ixodes scapularis TaxID=6945 RepID=B7QGE2_IXOSC|nr:hemelipoglycoprotein precursor, putative [Ixodes scapularis]|eukprot:XP_002401513.1 hemelipoglycoprotein precursor, putative [Ixodes scapularis]